MHDRTMSREVTFAGSPKLSQILAISQMARKCDFMETGSGKP